MKKTWQQKMFEGALRILARQEKKRSPELKNMAIGFVEAYILLCRHGQPAQKVVDDCAASGYVWDRNLEKWQLRLP